MKTKEITHVYLMNPAGEHLKHYSSRDKNIDRFEFYNENGLEVRIHYKDKTSKCWVGMPYRTETELVKMQPRITYNQFFKYIQDSLMDDTNYKVLGDDEEKRLVLGFHMLTDLRFSEAAIKGWAEERGFLKRLTIKADEPKMQLDITLERPFMTGTYRPKSIFVGKKGDVPPGDHRTAKERKTDKAPTLSTKKDWVVAVQEIKRLALEHTGESAKVTYNSKQGWVKAVCSTSEVAEQLRMNVMARMWRIFSSPRVNEEVVKFTIVNKKKS